MADPTVTPTAAPLLFGRYRVLEQLGETRLSTVYTASDERLQRRVLIHLLRKELAGQDRPRSRFIAEIGESARRSHQALLEVFDSGEAAGRPFMVTEHVSGRALRGLGLLTIEQALLYLRQIAGAVAACQAQASAAAPAGLYHPPISSSNVLLVDEGRVKLLDSWQLPLGEVLADQAHYRAPELSEGQPASPASAVYALGLLLYELITGERPISGPDARSIALAHLSARIPPLAQSRPNIYLPMAEQLVARATARLPQQRFADAQALGAALDGLWRDLGATTQRIAIAPARAAAGRPAAAPAAAPPLPAAAPAAPPPAEAAARRPRPSGLTGFSLSGRLGRQAAPSVDPDALRKRSLAHSLLGWLVMIGLLLLVVAGSYIGANALINQLSGVSTPNLPSIPGLPSAEGGGGPLEWLQGLIGRDEIYIVNLAEGLNLRSQPDATDSSNLLAVIPNGTPVRKLAGPQTNEKDDNQIPWLRVSVEVKGRQVEGWMSLNYLRKEQ